MKQSRRLKRYSDLLSERKSEYVRVSICVSIYVHVERKRERDQEADEGRELSFSSQVRLMLHLAPAYFSFLADFFI